MADNKLDVRELRPAKRHPAIHEAFSKLESGEVLTLVNDHDPKPLFYEFQAEVETFDTGGYVVEERGPNEFVARLPKK